MQRTRAPTVASHAAQLLRLRGDRRAVGCSFAPAVDPASRCPRRLPRGSARSPSPLGVLPRRQRPRVLGPSSAPLLPSIPVVTAPVVDAPAPGPASPLVPEYAPTSAGEIAARRRRVVLV